MAKANYPEELLHLVDEYLTDGIISAKERQVLLNKAQSMGVNVDEFDLYIDAQQQKADQQIDAAAAKKRGKTCPFCGGSVPQLTDKCPHCGETVTPEASEELQEIFDNLEEALVEFKSGKDIERNKANVERYMRKAKMYYDNNPKVKKLLDEVQKEAATAEGRAKSNARKKTLVSILNYNKKLTIGIIIVLVILIIVGLKSLFTEDPMDKWEKEQKEYAENREKEEKQEKEQFADFTKQINDYVKAGNLDDAKAALEDVVNENDYNFGQKYDAIYLKVINAYLKANNYDSAEELGSALRSKIGSDYRWSETSCYKTLKSKFKSANRDFSGLKYSGDNDD